MQLRRVLLGFRHHAGISTRALALDIGIGYATLNRFENGEEISGDNLKKIIQWLLADSEVGPRKQSGGVVVGII